MRSTARFLEATLLGVALGVGLGFWVFRRGAQRGLKDLWPPVSQPVTPQGPTPTPSKREIAPQAYAPVGPIEQETTAAPLATESEIQTSSEVVEEPVVGLEPSPVPIEEEETTVETTLSIPSEMEAYASVEVEPLDVEGIPVWADIPVPEVEVEPDVEAAVEELQAEDALVPEAAVEETHAEGAAVEESAAEEQVAEEQVAEEPVAEEPVAEEPFVEESLAEPFAAESVSAEVAEEIPEDVEIEAPPVATPADDLKARIEETRRRIRRELEEPFVMGGGVAAAGISELPQVEPEIGEALAVEPAAEEQSSLGMEEATTPSAGGAEVSAVAEGEEGISEVEGEASDLDYEAMRSRIEETRSRLKAKAFDAMMTGESALLGRDSGDADVTLPTPTEVDGDIVQTIDETLREEET